MIKTVKLENFKSHLSTRLNLDDSRLHAIVGQNSSGKTSILQSLHYLSQLVDNSFKKIFQHEHDPQHLVTVGCKSFSISVNKVRAHSEEISWETNISFKYALDGWHPTAEWIMDLDGKSGALDVADGWSASLKKASTERAVYLKLVSNYLIPASYSDEVSPFVRYNGEGLAPALDYLRNEYPKKFEELQRLLKQVVPGVQEIGIKRAKVKVSRSRSIEVDGKAFVYDHTEEMSGQEVVVSMNSGARIPAHAVSEGTMLTLGLLAVVLHPKRPSLILLDDIEQGLHPQAQKELIGVLKEIIHLNPDLQILFATHSPYIVDELEPSQVHVLSTDASGYTQAKRLDEHPDVKRALQVLTTGEFWDAEGEEWVLEDNAPNG
ncbi:MAG: AAA family ATPase [Chloroflexi bacterium]|nr:AAA family ATPase [Chloroflexota bacterium]